MATDEAVKAFAAEMAAAFETVERPDGERIVVLKESAREDYKDIVYAVHESLGHFLPSDTVYEEIHDCLSAIEEADDIEAPEFIPDIYTGRLYAWLSDDLSRSELVDEVLREMDPPTLIEAIQGAQVMEMENVAAALVEAITERLDETEADEDEEDDEEMTDAEWVALATREVERARSDDDRAIWQRIIDNGGPNDDDDLERLL